MKHPFQPGDIVALKSHPKDKMTIERIYKKISAKKHIEFMATCAYRHPYTKQIIYQDCKAILLTKID